jgi:C-terminal processing protease CtpA/Prc
MEKLNTPTKQYETEYQHVFAPPGKVGVAIDVVNGNPTVHKIKRGSPLEGLLKPKDLVIAIDDVDTTSMSAADVTHLMVKRMNYRRKITFVRKDS